MASHQNTKAVNLIAGEDLRGALHEVLIVENDAGQGKVIRATSPTNQAVIGVLAEEPATDRSTDGIAVPVVLLQGVVKMKAGAVITAGQLVVVDATAGRVAGVANVGALGVDQFAIGVALETAADGDIFEVLAQTIGGPHSV